MLTTKQKQLFEFLSDYISNKGIAPSFEEMKNAVNLKSKSGIHRLILSLEDRGFIRRLKHKARAMEVTKSLNNNFNIHKEMNNNNLISIPLLGSIAAGNPIEAIENSDENIQVPLNLISSNKKNYVLKVEGDSMVNKGIVDGDKAIIEFTNNAENGDIVVALINDQDVTLKKLKKDKDKIHLIPANDNYKTQTFNSTEIKIQGKLKGIIRSY